MFTFPAAVGDAVPVAAGVLEAGPSAGADVGALGAGLVEAAAAEFPPEWDSLGKMSQ
jgi:hypothetical protein